MYNGLILVVDEVEVWPAPSVHNVQAEHSLLLNQVGLYRKVE